MLKELREPIRGGVLIFLPNFQLLIQYKRIYNSNPFIMNQIKFKIYFEN